MCVVALLPQLNHHCSSTSMMICCVASFGSRVHSTWCAFQSLRWQNVEQYGVRRHSEHSAIASRLQLAHCFESFTLVMFIYQQKKCKFTFFDGGKSMPGMCCMLFGSSPSSCARATNRAASRSSCIFSIWRTCSSLASLMHRRKSLVALVICAHNVVRRSSGRLASAITAGGEAEQIELIFIIRIKLKKKRVTYSGW